MSSKIFISYRRSDSSGYAGRVHDRLLNEFGRDILFMDVDSIPLGTNFASILNEAVGKSDVLLALIGRDWLEARDAQGQRRLDSADDFVRIEIGSALGRKIPVVPILLEGTQMPQAADLPQELQPLALQNGIEVRHASFHGDLDRLVKFLKKAVKIPQSRGAAGALGDGETAKAIEALIEQTQRKNRGLSWMEAFGLTLLGVLGTYAHLRYQVHGTSAGVLGEGYRQSMFIVLLGASAVLTFTTALVFSRWPRFARFAAVLVAVGLNVTLFMLAKR